MRSDASTITGRGIARNTLLNFLGLSAPALLALVCVPYLIGGMGTERFGVLTVAWTAVGYFSLFDLGLGPALTKVVAERLGAGRKEDAASVAWTGLVLMALLGTLGGGVLALATPALVQRVLNIPAALQPESLWAFYLLAFSIPWVITTAGLRGILEAHQRFGIVSAIRLPMGVFTYGAPLAVLPFSTSLSHVVAVLVAGRVIAWAAHLVLCLREVPYLRHAFAVRWELFGLLARFGGWMTVSNVASTLMVYFDRVLIGAVLTMAAVTYYTTPYDLVTKAWMIPSAVLGVVFPAFSATFAQDRERTARLYDRAIRAIFLVIFPVALVLVTLAREGLTVWLGAAFAQESFQVLQWLAVGVFINSIGMMPAAVLQGTGRPDLTGKLNLAELPFYLGALWWLLHTYGIEGAAVAWVLRVGVDTTVLCIMAERILPGRAGILRRTAMMVVPGLGVLASAALLPTLTVRILFLLGAALLFAVAAWYGVLSPEERVRIRARWSAIRKVPAAASSV